MDAEVKQCPVCDSVTKGPFPADRHGRPLQYGLGIKAFIINLLVTQMVSLNRVQKLVKSMMGELVAEATLLRFVFRLHQALEDSCTLLNQMPIICGNVFVIIRRLS